MHMHGIGRSVYRHPEGYMPVATADVWQSCLTCRLSCKTDLSTPWGTVPGSPANRAHPLQSACCQTAIWQLVLSSSFQYSSIQTYLVVTG